jgi:hypothetical protein
MPKGAPKLLPYAKHLHECQSASDWFKDISPTLADFLAAINALDTAQTKASTHAPGAVAVRDAAVTTLEDMIRGNFRGVEAIGDAHADQRAEIYQASGYETAIAHDHAANVFAMNKGEHAGEAILTLPVFADRATYFAQYTIEGSNVTVDVPESTTARIVLKNLPLHQTIHIRYRASAPGGKHLDWSYTIAYFVV